MCSRFQSDSATVSQLSVPDVHNAQPCGVQEAITTAGVSAVAQLTAAGRGGGGTCDFTLAFCVAFA